MFAACILFALPTIKETWVKADTHPVYNSRVQAIPMWGRRFRYSTDAETLKKLQQARNELIVLDCAQSRDMIDRITGFLNVEAAKPKPDPAAIEAWNKIRIHYQNRLLNHVDALKNNPELEKQIEAKYLKLKQKK